MCVVFFFKQKTAYEMRISDWSSDVCSSDLGAPVPSVSQTAEPTVPTVRAMVASSTNVSGEAIHTAPSRDDGSIRAYIRMMFSQTNVSALCPPSAATSMRAPFAAASAASAAPAQLPVRKRPEEITSDIQSH